MPASDCIARYELASPAGPNDSHETDEQQAAEPTTVTDVNTAPDPMLKAMTQIAAQDKSFRLGLTLHSGSG